MERGAPGDRAAALARRPRTLRRRVEVVVAGLVGVVLALAAMAVLALRERDAADDRARHTWEPAHHAAGDLSAALVDQETAALGYVVTGDEAFLEPYLSARVREDEAVARLRTALAGHTRELGLVEAVGAASAAWRSEAAGPAIAAVAAGREQDAVALVRSEGGRRFGALRAELGELQRAVGQAFDAALSDRDDTRVRDTVLAVGGSMAALVLGVVALIVLRRSLTEPVERLQRRVEDLAAGRLDRPLPVEGPEELARLAADIEEMRVRLLDEVAHRVARRLLDAQEEERRRLASDLHDDAVQRMTAAGLRLQVLELRLGDHDLAPVAQAIGGDVAAAVARLRRLMFDIYPATLEDDGLAAALELWCAETLDGGVAWRVVDDGGGPCDASTAAIAYRLAREALVNVHRHAGASQVEVRVGVRGGGDAPRLHVEVRDDGQGFVLQRADGRTGHLGLAVARRIAGSVGGSWHVASAPGAGTRVDLVLPIGGAASG